VPLVTLAVYKELFPIVQFDLLPMGPLLYDHVFVLEDDEPISDIFEIGGYDSMYFLNSLGFLGFMYAMLPLSTVVFIIGAQCGCSRNNCCRKFAKYSKKKKRGILWNGMIGLLFDSFLIVCIAASINLSIDHQPNSNSEWVNMGFTYAFLGLIVVGLPLFVSIFYCCNYDEFEDKAFTEKFGFIY